MGHPDIHTESTTVRRQDHSERSSDTSVRRPHQSNALETSWRQPSIQPLPGKSVRHPRQPKFPSPETSLRQPRRPPLQCQIRQIRPGNDRDNAPTQKISPLNLPPAKPNSPDTSWERPRQGTNAEFPPHSMKRPPTSHWTRLSPPTEAAHITANRLRLATKINGKEAQAPIKIRGLVYPRSRAQNHPAAPLLRQYATHGCPVSVGRDWTLSELDAAVQRGPHISSLEPDAINQIQLETKNGTLGPKFSGV